MRKLIGLGLVCCLTAGGLAGCGLFGAKFEAPHLAVIKVELLDSDILSQHFKVRLRVQNPNSRALPVRGITCKLELAGDEFGNGVSGESFEVPAYGEAEFDMLLTTNLASAVMRFMNKKDRNADSLEYRISGKVDLKSAWFRSIPFSDTGQLPVR